MPACSSDCSYSSGARFQSSSPPNSRSNSASPPLSWTVTSTVSPISGSAGKVKRYASNRSLFEENSVESSATGSERNGTLSPSRSHLEHRLYKLIKNSGDTEEISYSIVNQQRTNEAATRKIIGIKEEEKEIGDCSVAESSSGVAGSLLIPMRILAWYINLLLGIVRKSYETLIYIIWSPVLWVSAWICVFWGIIQLPLIIIKWLIRVLYTPAFERARTKRCVLISGGSTVQALHLARNFYKAGARVVVCEIEGLFGLARFSTACSRFYSVPRPGPGTAAEYVDALKRIVKREKALYFIPVSCTSGAYYDALAKPHLEIMGCECFVPDATQVTALEDPLKLLQRCSSLGLSTPVNYIINSPDSLVRLYENGSIIPNERHVMLAAGPVGMRERIKLRLPSSRAEGTNLRRKLEQYEISERKPWIVIREPPIGPNRGHQFVTCTTIKDSRVVANVTCRIDKSQALIPESRSDVDQWLEVFFGRPFATRFNGHLSFKLALGDDDDDDNDNDGVGLVFVGCRVGVPLPYLCFTSVHPRLVWRPCRHFSRHNSANFLLNERYKRTTSNDTNDFFLKTRSADSTNDNNRIFSAVTTLDKRDALFVYWDPLPYCAYYHLQLPFRRLAGVIRERPGQHKPPLAVVH